LHDILKNLFERDLSKALQNIETIFLQNFIEGQRKEKRKKNSFAIDY
jgi:hypothetical protein